MRLDANSESKFSFLYVIFRRRLATLIHLAHTHTHTHTHHQALHVRTYDDRVRYQLISYLFFSSYFNNTDAILCICLNTSNLSISLFLVVALYTAFFFSSCPHSFSLHYWVFVVSFAWLRHAPLCGDRIYSSVCLFRTCNLHCATWYHVCRVEQKTKRQVEGSLHQSL